MSTRIKETKQAVLTAIKKDNFTPSEIISEYNLSDIAEVITEIIYEKRVKQPDNKIDLSEVELQNIYLLARSIISKNMISKRERALGSSKKTDITRPSLIPQAVLEFMYQLHPAH